MEAWTFRRAWRDDLATAFALLVIAREELGRVVYPDGRPDGGRATPEEGELFDRIGKALVALSDEERTSFDGPELGKLLRLVGRRWLDQGSSRLAEATIATDFAEILDVDLILQPGQSLLTRAAVANLAAGYFDGGSR